MEARLLPPFLYIQITIIITLNQQAASRVYMLHAASAGLQRLRLGLVTLLYNLVELLLVAILQNTLYLAFCPLALLSSFQRFTFIKNEPSYEAPGRDTYITESAGINCHSARDETKKGQ